MPMNSYNQSGFGGAQQSGGDQMLQMPGQKMQRPRRQQFQTAQPPQAPQPQQPQTFAQMQANGQARPNPPAPPPQPSPVQGQLQGAVSQALTAPSRYDLDAVKQVRTALQGDLQQQYGAQQKSLNEELARRGLSESTIAGQRYSDLASEQARSMSNLDAQLLRDFASTEAADRTSALGSGQNFLNSENATDLANRQFGESSRQFDLQQQLAQALGLGGLDLQKQSLAQSGSQFDKSLGLQQRSLDQSGNQFDKSLQEQIASRLGSQGLQQQQLAQQGDQFSKSLAEQQASRQQSGDQFTTQQELARILGLGNLGLQEKSLAQSGSQFDKSLAEQQAARSQSGDQFSQNLAQQNSQFTLAQELQKMLGLGSQDLQKQQLAQQGSQGNTNLLLQFLNLVGGNEQPELAAQIAKQLGLPAPKTAEEKQRDQSAAAAKKQADFDAMKKHYLDTYGPLAWRQAMERDHPSLFQ